MIDLSLNVIDPNATRWVELQPGVLNGLRFEVKLLPVEEFVAVRSRYDVAMGGDFLKEANDDKAVEMLVSRAENLKKVANAFCIGVKYAGVDSVEEAIDGLAVKYPSLLWLLCTQAISFNRMPEQEKKVLSEQSGSEDSSITGSAETQEREAKPSNTGVQVVDAKSSTEVESAGNPGEAEKA